MSSILLIFTVLLALLLVLLAVPITVAFRIDHIKEIKGQVRFHWLFGLVKYRIGIPGTVRTGPQHKRKPPGQSGKRKRGEHARGIFALIKQSAVRRHVIRFIKNLLRATHERDLYLRLRIGLGDPADTGRLWAIIGPIAGIAANLRGAEVRIEPEFIDPVMEVESHGEVCLIPLQFIVLAITFVVSPTTLCALRTLRRSTA